MNLFSVFIALVEMTVILLSAGVLSRLIRRHSASVSALIGVMGLVGSAVVFLLSVSGVPRFWETEMSLPSSVAVAGPSDSRRELVQPNVQSVSKAGDAVAAPSAQVDAGWQMPVLDVVARLSKVSILPETQRSDRLKWFPSMIVAVLFFLWCPVLLGILATIRLHRGSRPVSIDAINETLGDFVAERSIAMDFRVVQDLSSPCVTLFGRNTIYLPPDWADWRPEELAAALRHERAHLERKDPLLRMIAESAASIQRFHPLAKRVRDGAILSQEVAADLEAAGGDAKRFASSLSRIALRLDQQVECRVYLKRNRIKRLGTVSVSSSHLIRRIDMLLHRPQETTSRAGVWITRCATLPVLAICVCCSAWSLRAEPPKTSSGASESPSPRVARLPSRETERETGFSASPISPWKLIGENDNGYAVIRADRLAETSAGLNQMLLAAAAPILDSMWTGIATNEAAGARSDLGLTLSNIRTVCASMTFSATNQASENAEDSIASRVTLGSSYGRIGFENAINHDRIRSALDLDRISQVLIANGTTPEKIGGMTQRQFAELILDGLLSDGESSDELVFAKEKSVASMDETLEQSLRKAWTAVDGGTIAASYSLSTELGEVQDERAEVANKLLAAVACMGVGVDFDELEPAKIRIAFVPRDGMSVAELRSTVASTFEFIEQELEAVDSGGAVEADQNIGRAKTVLASHRIESFATSGSKDPDCVRIHLSVPIESLSLFLKL